ncbi:ISL3 family transposase [Streptomyces nigra]
MAGPVVIDLSVRRLYCENSDCPKTTFAEQVTGLTVRYQRRTPGPAARGERGGRGAGGIGRGPAAGRAALRAVLGNRPELPDAHPRAVGGSPARAGHRRVRPAPGPPLRHDHHRRRHGRACRRARGPWLRKHARFEVVCRDGAGSFAQAITDEALHVVQVADRWHLWHLLGEAAHREVLARSACWGPLGPPICEGRRAQTTRERWQQVHDLRDQGVGLLECARRLNLALNTVKRYARHDEPDRLIRTPQYRPTLVDPYREYLRKRRATDPAVPITHLLAEIRELGYTGSANLLVRYITQGRVEADHAALSPRRTARLLLTDLAHLKEEQTALRNKLSAACPEMTALATQVSDFAALLTPAPGNPGRLNAWIARTRGRPALPALLRHRPGTRPGRRRRRPHPALAQRTHRGRQPQDQTAQAPDLRPGRLPAPPPAHPAQLTLRQTRRSPATKILEDPNDLQSLP